MRICVVEDEHKVLHFLKEALQREGHVVEACDNYESAKDVAEVGLQNFDVLILDRMLNGKDGMSLIRPFREKYPQCRILILSAINTAEEKAQALDQGADDYISKPFSLLELSARLRAMSRRADQKNSLSNFVQCKDIFIDPLSRTVKVGEVKIDLSNKEFQLLFLFCKHPGRVYNKFEILDHVWNTQYDIESNVVEVTIKNLRRALEEKHSTLEILSKRNVGYWVEA